MLKMHLVHLYDIPLSDQVLGAHRWYKMNFIVTTALISGSHHSDPRWQLECVCYQVRVEAQLGNRAKSRGAVL